MPMIPDNYMKRIIEKEVEKKMRYSGAVVIEDT